MISQVIDAFLIFLTLVKAEATFVDICASAISLFVKTIFAGTLKIFAIHLTFHDFRVYAMYLFIYFLSIVVVSKTLTFKTSDFIDAI